MTNWELQLESLTLDIYCVFLYGKSHKPVYPYTDETIKHLSAIVKILIIARSTHVSARKAFTHCVVLLSFIMNVRTICMK